MMIKNILSMPGTITSRAKQLVNSVKHNGISFSQGQGSNPARPQIRYVFSRPLQQQVKSELMSSRSLHSIFEYQRSSISSAAIVLADLKGKSAQNYLKSLSKQLTESRFKPDRLATKEEWNAAKKLQNDLVNFISRQFQKSDTYNLSHKEADRAALDAFKNARIIYLNKQPWNTIQKSIQCGDQEYVSIQRPAAQLKLGVDDIFPVSYQGKGICSSSAKERQHATNLWNSVLGVKGVDGQQQLLFSGIRHGILSPYKLEGGFVERQRVAQTRAKEVATAALFSRPALLADALDGRTVSLQLVSSSLVTASHFSGKEDVMLRDQILAWEALGKEKPTILQVRNERGEIQDVRINLDIAAMNFGVNEMALKFGLGHKQSDRYNAIAMEQLFGKDLDPTADPGGWVGEYLQNNPENSGRVWELSRQLKTIWMEKSHHRDGGEPYKAAQRTLLLANEIGAVPCWNCKSGKDRTGMLDAELKRELISLNQGNNLSKIGGSISQPEQILLQNVLGNSGNLEVQAYNTGVKGNKVIKDFGIDAINLSYKKRIGSFSAWLEVKGLSQFFKS